MNPEYLGDGVYATFDGYNIVLTTGNHDSDIADAVIALEPKVMARLIGYKVKVDAYVREQVAAARECCQPPEER